ncbi:ABC transporter substrate-binding protein [Herbiconiux sp. SYSU D00978]|uniref:ABC transporter substrate-binding protein n=1 Tax=Herbiconiux sp. SYSU D00978 TaxID=2812562 RepID=UPI001A96FFFB|nr:ABC transporter substrate-binding protein [Herbiconiux sp. SYSU D00978]
MITARNKGRFALAAAAVGVSLALSGCGSSDPLASGSGGSGGGDDETIVIGSQAYYSNEIIAEIYAQALENAGLTVERQFNIGQRKAYLPEVESGAIDLFPEYTGNLLQEGFDPDTTARTSEDVYAALQEALPDNLTVLDQAEATDQDSYVVTTDFAEANGLTSIGDLASVPDLAIAGNSELKARAYGEIGLRDVYGVTVAEWIAIEDSGGPLTIEALVNGDADVANIYTGSPAIATNDLVALDDPEGLFLASHVVPLVNEEIAGDVEDVINEVQAALTAEDLVALNALSVDEEQSADQIASDWLSEKGLV